MALNKAALGKRIRLIRKRRGLTQQVLAELIECTPTHMSFCETGCKNMSMDTFVRIANALHASADELLMDSLENTIKVSNHEFASLLADCNDYEKGILLDVLIATKAALRLHSSRLRN